MAPAHQRLESDDASSLDLYLRLVQKEELLHRDRFAKLRDHGDARADFRIHGIGEEPIGASTFRLRSVECDVGMGKQRLCVERFRSIDSDADARAAADSIAVDRERIADGLQDLVGEKGGVRRLLDADQDDGKLVAAEPSDRVGLANDRPEPLPHLLKQKIANGMAEGVVDILEVIEVEIQHRESLVTAARPGDCLLERLDEDAAICQAGQDCRSGPSG